MKRKIPWGFITFSIAFVLTGLTWCATTKAQLIAVTGKYTGTGNNNNALVGLGFSPDFLLINSASNFAQLATSSLPVNSTKSINGGSVQGGLIRSLDADGFTVDNDNNVNQVNVEYNYLAFKNEPGILEMGSYTGNNTDNRNITGLSFSPEMLIIFSEDNNQKPVFSTVTMGVDNSMNFIVSGFVNNRIQAFNANGFQIGKNAAVNQSGITYHYIAIKSSPGKVFVGSYLGDGINNRIIPTAGTGSFVMIKTDGKNAICRSRDMPTDVTYYFRNNAPVSNRIKQNTVNGFELGNHDEVNQTGREYYYLKLIGLSNILAVELMSFDAGITAKNSKLEWKVASAVNDHIDHFNIERSNDLLNYTTMARVEAKADITSTVSYIYTDMNTPTGYSYYRLKMIGKNSEISYSETKKVFIGEEKDYNIYPNPFTGNQLIISRAKPGKEIQITITDMNGRKVDSHILQKEAQSLNIRIKLPPGIYFVIGRKDNTLLFTKRFIKP